VARTQVFASLWSLRFHVSFSCPPTLPPSFPPPPPPTPPLCPHLTSQAAKAGGANPNTGIDGIKGELADMSALGVWDTYAVKVQTLKTAIEVCFASIPPPPPSLSLFVCPRVVQPFGKRPAHSVFTPVFICVCVIFFPLLPPVRDLDPSNRRRPQWRVKEEEG
jgi:hypothetical protein